MDLFFITDTRHDLFLSFEESVFGGQQDIKVSCSETCENCSGTGAKSSSCIKVYTNCGGRGGVMKTQQTPFGIISQVALHGYRELRLLFNFQVFLNVFTILRKSLKSHFLFAILVLLISCLIRDMLAINQLYFLFNY